VYELQGTLPCGFLISLEKIIASITHQGSAWKSAGAVFEPGLEWCQKKKLEVFHPDYPL